MSVETFQELGSLNDYLERHGLQDIPAAHQEYFTALHGIREARAKELGISLDDLHAMNFYGPDSLLESKNS